MTRPGRIAVTIATITTAACGGGGDDDGAGDIDAATEIDADLSDAAWPVGCIAYRSITDPRSFYQGGARDYCTANLAGAANATITHTFDMYLRRTSTVTTYQSGAGSMVTYTYDATSGDLTQVDTLLNLARSRQLYFYDGDCNLSRSELDSDSNGSIDQRTVFAYSAGKVVTRTVDNVMVNAFTYDGMGRVALASAYLPSRVDEHHVWSGAFLDRIDVDNGADGSTDAMLEVTQTSSQILVTSATATTTIDVDARGRVTRYNYDSTGTSGDQTNTYVYDCLP